STPPPCITLFPYTTLFRSPFMGSEFSFEDIGGQQVDDYTYKYLRDEKVDGQDTFVIESYPKEKNSGYTKVITWVDKEHYRTLKRSEEHTSELQSREKLVCR